MGRTTDFRMKTSSYGCAQPRSPTSESFTGKSCMVKMVPSVRVRAWEQTTPTGWKLATTSRCHNSREPRAWLYQPQASLEERSLLGHRLHCRRLHLLPHGHHLPLHPLEIRPNNTGNDEYWPKKSIQWELMSFQSISSAIKPSKDTR